MLGTVVMFCIQGAAKIKALPSWVPGCSDRDQAIFKYTWNIMSWEERVKGESGGLYIWGRAAQKGEPQSGLGNKSIVLKNTGQGDPRDASWGDPLLGRPSAREALCPGDPLPGRPSARETLCWGDFMREYG